MSDEEKKIDPLYWERDSYVRRLTALYVLLPLVPILIIGSILNHYFDFSKHVFYSFAGIVTIAFAVLTAESKASKKYDKDK